MWQAVCLKRAFEHVDRPPASRISVVLAVAQRCAIPRCVIERVTWGLYQVKWGCACGVPFHDGSEDVEIDVYVLDEPRGHEASPELVLGDVRVTL